MEIFLVTLKRASTEAEDLEGMKRRRRRRKLKCGRWSLVILSVIHILVSEPGA